MAGEGEEAAGLKMLAEKTLQSPIDPRHITYCPTMDLLALATADGQVHVFRTNGQRVFGIPKKETTGDIADLVWKPDGQSLAVAYHSSIFLVSAHTGKVMYEKDGLTSSKSPICCIGWGSNFTTTPNTHKAVSNFEDGITLNDFIASANESKDLHHVPDLPVELAFIDVAGTLPRLSTLPMGGSRGDVFSSRLSLDTLFKPLPTDSAGTADVLLVGHEDGTIHLSMSEDFSIGTLNLRNAASSLSGSTPFLHCSHPLSTTHALLVSTKTGEAEELQLVPFDLRLISSAGRYLSLLASKVTELHNLLRYVDQNREHIFAEINTTQDLPSRFVRNINETLSEGSDSTWIQAAYHLVVTGHCYPEVKDWLVDEVGERGHKRWDKVATAGYESIRRLTHENLLPALDRLSVLVSRLRGLSRFQGSEFLLGLSTLDLDNIIDSINCLQLQSHGLLKCAISEAKQFSAFSTWLRHEIEKQATDPTSASAQEIAEKDVVFDYCSILEYIQGAMTASQMLTFSGSHSESKPQWDLKAEGGVLFELYKKQIKDEANGSSPQKRLPGLDGLIRHLHEQCGSLFDRISDTQRRNVQIGAPTYLGAGSSACVDMRMVTEKQRGPMSNMSIYIALAPSGREEYVRIFRVSLVVENGVSSSTGVQSARIPTPAGAVRDVKFVDDELLMLAFVGQGGDSYLLKIEFRLREGSYSSLVYREGNLTRQLRVAERDGRMSAERSGINLRNEKDVAALIVQTFPAGTAWMPQRLEINGRRGRRTICVLAENKLQYRQFAIDELYKTDSQSVKTKKLRKPDVAIAPA